MMKFYKISLILVGIVLFTGSPAPAQQNSLSQTSLDATGVQDNTANTYNPTFGRLSLQFGSGVLFGAAGGVLGGLGGIALAPKVEGPGGLIVLGYAALGSLVGYTAGSAFGVYTVANSNKYNASYGYILLGNLVGTATGIGLSVLAGSNNNLEIFFGIIALSAPIVGGMIANNLSISKRKAKASALLNISNHKTILSTPSIKLTEVGNHYITESDTRYSPTVELLNISL